LDLKTGIVTDTYIVDNINYTKEIFASVRDQTIAIRTTADKTGSISFNTKLCGLKNNAHSNYATDYFQVDAIGNDQISLTGK